VVRRTASVSTRARELRPCSTEYPAPDGTVSLIPLHLSYCYEQDGDDDIVGVVVDTTLGQFALWLQSDTAIQLAGQLVQILENREALRARYTGRLNPPPRR
jgi:hypothetical protein